MQKWKKEITWGFIAVQQHLKRLGDIVRSIQENTNLEHIENEDQKGQVYSEILRGKDKHSRGQRVMLTINTAS